VAVVDRGGRISYEHIDDLSRLDMNARTAAEGLTADWLKERVQSRKLEAQAPPVPRHLLNRTSENLPSHAN
jgi:hypothetical protein